MARLCAPTWCGALDSFESNALFVLYRCAEKDNTEMVCSNEEKFNAVTDRICY